MRFTNLNISVIRTSFGPRGVRICEGLLYIVDGPILSAFEATLDVFQMYAFKCTLIVLYDTWPAKSTVR